MPSLDDVGKDVLIQGKKSDYLSTVKVIMAIQAPRGKCFIFDSDILYTDTKCEAIRAFMEQHARYAR